MVATVGGYPSDPMELLPPVQCIGIRENFWSSFFSISVKRRGDCLQSIYKSIQSISRIIARLTSHRTMHSARCSLTSSDIICCTHPDLHFPHHEITMQHRERASEWTLKRNDHPNTPPPLQRTEKDTFMHNGTEMPIIFPRPSVHRGRSHAASTLNRKKWNY